MPQATESKQPEHRERALTETWEINADWGFVKYGGCHGEEQGSLEPLEFIRKAGEKDFPCRE